MDLNHILESLKLIEEAKSIETCQAIAKVLHSYVKTTQEQLPLEYTVQLGMLPFNASAYKIQAIKDIRQATYLGLKEAKDMVEAHNSIVSRTLTYEAANILTKQLTSYGYDAKMYPTTKLSKVLFEGKT